MLEFMITVEPGDDALAADLTAAAPRGVAVSRRVAPEADTTALLITAPDGSHAEMLASWLASVLGGRDHRLRIEQQPVATTLRAIARAIAATR